MERSNCRRVIINTDAKNEADDQFAIVEQDHSGWPAELPRPVRQ